MSLEKIDTNQIVMAIFGSLLAFMFYGRIQDAADIVQLKEKVEQGDGERIDLWSKYNAAGAQYMKHMIEDAREKEQIKEQILQVKLEEANRELDYYKNKFN
jgi:hypothetical protein